MELSSIASRFGKFLTDNSPSILTAVAVTGTITTAVLAGRASFKAAELIQEDERIEGVAGDPVYRFKERAQLTWKLYIPAVATGVATIACIVAANQIGNRRAAAMAAAYSLADKAFEEYKEKIVEKLGEKKEKAARTELAQEYVRDHPPTIEDSILIGDTTSVLCCDLYTKRYLLSDMETIRRAANDINYQVNHDYYASLSDFYDRIGMEHTSMSDDVGWNADKLLDLEFDVVLTPSGKPCLTFDFTTAPIRGFHRLQ